MPILKGRRANGHPVALTLPPAPSVATSYTMTQSASSGTTGTADTLTISPVGGNWPTAAITITVSGVTATLANGSGGTLSGSVLTVPSGTTTICTVTMTPSTAGTATISATNSAGLTNPGSLTYTASALATSYTMTQSAASGQVNVADVVSFAPVGGKWAAGLTITVTATGASPTVANGSGGTFSGSVLTLPSGTTTTCTINVTPTAAGTMTIHATNNGGLSNPGDLSYSANSSGYVSLTDLIWTQPDPFNGTVFENNGDNFKFIVGTFAPVGGTGPFAYSIDNAQFPVWNVPRDSGLTRTTDPSLYPWVITPFATGADTTSNLTLRVTDATGATVAKTVTITRDSASARIGVNGNRTWPSSIVPSIRAETFDVFGNMTHGAINVSDASGIFQYAFGAITTQSFGTAPVGSYPITLSSPGLPNHTITVTIISGAIAGPILLVPKLMSSAMPAGTIVGQLECTTPFNSPAWSINDPSGKLAVTQSGRIALAVDQPPVGTYTFTATVTEGTATRSDSQSITCVTGVVLPPTNMTMTVASGLLNDRRNQHIGDPVVTGVTGTKAWLITHQTYYNEPTTVGDYGIPAPISINSTTGAVDAPGWLSADPDGVSVGSGSVTISCSDGINSCTQTFSVPVAWAPATTYHVGTGMAAAHPGFGFDTFVAACNGTGASTSGHTGTIHLLVYADSNVDKYVGDNVSYLYGPLIIEGVAANGHAQPRFGGASTNNSNSGNGPAGKGNLLLHHGDAIVKNIESSFVHGSSTFEGPEGIRKEGNSYGNLTVLDCYIHDCDNGLLTSFGHGELIVDGCEFANCGTSHNGAGPCHNMYLGEMTLSTVRNTVSRRSTYGHLLKVRSKKAVVHDCRLFDGVTGNGGHVINFPFCGDMEVYNCKLSKGPMPGNPDLIRCGEDGLNPNYGGAVWETNTLSVHDNEIEILTQLGSHFGTPTVVGFFPFSNKLGVPATASIVNNSILYNPQAQLHQTYSPSSQSIADPTPNIYTITGNTTRTTPVAISTSRPFLSGNLPTSGPLFRNVRYGDDSFANFDGVYQWQDRDLLDLPVSTSIGTVVCNMWASNDLQSQGAGTPNPFGPGTTVSIIQDGVYYPFLNPTPWAPIGRYSVTSNSDGSGTLTVAGTLSAGIDYVQVRFHAPNGTNCDCRYPIVIS